MRAKVFVLSVLTLALVACGGDNVPKKTEVARAEIKAGQNFGIIKVTRDSSVELSCSGSVVNVEWDANKLGGVLIQASHMTADTRDSIDW